MCGRKSLRPIDILIVGLSLAASPFAEGAPVTREEAVTLARQGETETAVAALRELLATDPNDALVAYDLAIILTWAGRNREATDAFEKTGGDEPPEYVLGPVIRAYRDQKRFAEAERWARTAQQRYPLDPTWVKLLGLVLADEGKTKEARALLEPWSVTHPDDAEIWLALGYTALRSKDRAGSLRAYKEALRLQPKNREAMKAIAGVLRGDRPALEVQADQAAELVRRGQEMKPRDPRQPFEITDKAIARLNQLLEQARSSRNPNHGLTIRLRRDRVLALRNRERWSDAVRETEALRADGDTIPPYVREAEADSLLALRRPAEARRGYEDVLRADPTLKNAQIGRFFTLIEEERFDDAFEQIDQVSGAEALQARARMFADMPAAAWKMMLPLVEQRPDDAELRWVLGDIAAVRGWPHRGDQEIKFAATLAPEDKAVQIAMAETAFRRRHWTEARSRIAGLSEIYPDDARVRRLHTELRVQDSFQLLSEFHVTQEYGGSSSDENRSGNSPGSGVDWTTRLYSPPVAESWRFLGAWEHHTANTPEGAALRDRFGAGVRLALTDLTVQAIGWSNQGDISEPGASLSATWLPTDEWRFDLGAEYFAGDTPLRAVRNNITANSASFGVTYEWHESRTIALGVTAYDFSDDNRRTAARLVFAQKIIDIPHLDVTLRPEIYTSTNTSSDVPYFSPSRDVSTAITCDAEDVIWRRYEHVFGHRLAVMGGAYWQEDFGTSWIGSILYEQVFQYNPWIELRYGVNRRRSVYDGAQTPSTEGFIRLNLRF